MCVSPDDLAIQHPLRVEMEVQRLVTMDGDDQGVMSFAL